jgi:hypothetical protein
VTAQQLDVDVAPGLRHAIAVAHQQVEREDRPRHYQQKQAQQD